MTDDLNRRIERLELKHDSTDQAIKELVISTNRMGDLLEAQKGYLPKIEKLIERVTLLEIAASNANLVQRAFVWGAGTIGASAIIMAMTYVFRGA